MKEGNRTTTTYSLNSVKKFLKVTVRFVFMFYRAQKHKLGVLLFVVFFFFPISFFCDKKYNVNMLGFCLVLFCLVNQAIFNLKLKEGFCILLFLLNINLNTLQRKMLKKAHFYF